MNGLSNVIWTIAIILALILGARYGYGILREPIIKGKPIVLDDQVYTCKKPNIS